MSFGEAITLLPKRGLTLLEKRIDTREDATTYKNRRAEMYGELSLLIDPGCGPEGFGLIHSRAFVREQARRLGVKVNEGDSRWGFAIPGDTDALRELHRQLLPIPKLYVEGKLELPPKDTPPGPQQENKVTLKKLLGCSPDEADAVVLACHGMLHKAARSVAGAVV